MGQFAKKLNLSLKKVRGFSFTLTVIVLWGLLLLGCHNRPKNEKSLQNFTLVKQFYTTEYLVCMRGGVNCKRVIVTQKIVLV